MSPRWPGSQTEPIRARGAGTRNWPVRVEGMTEATSGFPVETWTTVVIPTYWASRKDLVGGEDFKAGQVSGAGESRVEGPYHPALDPDLLDVPKLRRFVSGSRVYDIVVASVLEGKAGIEFMTIQRNRIPESGEPK